MSQELDRADAWLNTKFAADATITSIVAGRIHSTVVPPGSTYPCVLYAYLGGFDSVGTGAMRILHSGLWVVRAIAAVEDWAAAPLGTLADRIDIILHRATGSAAGADGIVYTATRESPYREIEHETGGVELRHSGGSYRLLVQVPAS